MESSLIQNALDFAQFTGMGFYRVHADGRFLQCDAKARDVFRIPQKTTKISNHSIEGLYVVQSERQKHLANLDRSGGGPVSSVLSLRIGSEERLVYDICWRDTQDDNEGGCAGVIHDITEQMIFPTKMFENFLMGIYEVDSNNRIVRANKRMAQMVGYSKASELIGKRLSEFYQDTGDLASFATRVNKEGHAHEILAMRGPGSTKIEMEVFSQLMTGFGAARWGVAADVTRRERYYRALDHMPTGYYHVETGSGGKELITQCNEAFAHMFGFHGIEDALGTNIGELYAKKKDETGFLKELRRKHRDREPLRNYQLTVKRVDNGSVFTISIDAHMITDMSGKVMGREGTVRDISDEVRLSKEFEEAQADLKRTTADINKLIHSFLHPVLKFYSNAELLVQIATVLSIHLKLDQATGDTVTESGHRLEAALLTLTDYLSDSHGHQDLIEMLRKERNKLNYKIRKEKSQVLLYKSIRDVALDVLDALNKHSEVVAGSITPSFEAEVIEPLKVINFSYLVRSTELLRSETTIMTREVESLRTYLGLKKPRSYNFATTDLADIIERNIERFEPLVTQKGIRINYSREGNLTAELSEVDIDRLICNLLQNAYKYSQSGTERYLRIAASEVIADDEVELAIESYGLPIKSEEIESGYIYTFGGRGEAAYRADRAGTGVGLADAKDTVEAHGGRFWVTSAPPTGHKGSSRHSIPYITTAFVRLPKRVPRELKQ